MATKAQYARAAAKRDAREAVVASMTADEQHAWEEAAVVEALEILGPYAKPTDLIAGFTDYFTTKQTSAILQRLVRKGVVATDHDSAVSKRTGSATAAYTSNAKYKLAAKES